MGSKTISFMRPVSYLAALLFTLAMSAPLLAQGGAPAGAGPPPNISIKGEDQRRRASEAKLRNVEMVAGAEAESQKHIQAAISNMKQDFTRIQVLRNNIARDLVARKPLDYSLITEQTAEISKRAQRLNIYMLAHVPENKEPDITPDLKSEEMINALVKLCKLIDSFTENPALKNAATVDAKHVEKAKTDKARADADLLAIIKLSDRIHKKSDGLRTPK